jgi:hypothetical protein
MLLDLIFLLSFCFLVLGLLRHFNTHTSGRPPRRHREKQVKKKAKLKEAMMVKSS